MGTSPSADRRLFLGPLKMERQTFLDCTSLLIDEPDMPVVRAAINDRRVSGRWRPTT